MVYHVLIFSGVGSVEGLGTYDVYAFFVLSGFALAHVYPAGFDVRRFAVARIARIVPLYILASIATIALTGTTLTIVLLNVTGLFALWRPGVSSIPDGGWSIAIELVLYLLFPVLSVLSTRWLAVLFVASLVMRVVYVQAVWPQGVALAEVWSPYTQLPSFLVFFVGGMLGARVRLRSLGGWPFFVGVAIFGSIVVALQVAGLRDAMTGWLGIGLVLLTVAGVLLAASGGGWTGWSARVAETLGALSYPVYLLHFVVWATLGMLGLAIEGQILGTVLGTPILAAIVHAGFEVPVGRWIRFLGQPRRPPLPVVRV